MRKKFFVVFLLLLVTISILSNFIYAADYSGFVEKLPISDEGGVKDSLIGIIQVILSAVRAFGLATAVIIILVIGTKYMLASAGDRADIKKYAIKYVIGAIILFAASGLLTLVKQIIDSSLTNT